MENDMDYSSMIHEHRKIGIQLEYLTSKALAHLGFTAVQAHILLYILDHPEGTSLTAIRQEMGGSMSALSCLMKRLKKNGYVRVEQKPGDDRSKLLFGTEKGISAKPALRQTMEQASRQIFEGFSQAELQELDRFQKKLLDNLSQYASHQQLGGSIK